MDEEKPRDDTAQRTPAERRTGESVALERAAERISEKFPEVPREDIDRLVEEHSEEYEGAPVRDFVPVLVEHDVKAELRQSVD